MKKIFNRVMAFVALTLGLTLAACSDTPDTIDQIDLNRCLSPLNFTTSVANGRDVTFNWDVMQGSDRFVVEVYNDAAMTDLAETFTVDAADVPVTRALETDKTFYARVKAQSDDSHRADSKWTICEKKIATYEVKDALYPTIEARTATSVTVTWDATMEDADEVSRIAYMQVPMPASDEVQSVDLTAEDIEKGNCTISGLTASTQYMFTLYFKSADRGEVTAWTLPDLSSATSVATVEALKQALADGASKILVAYNDGAVYDLGAFVALTKPVAIYGEETPGGKKPAIAGNFELQAGVASFHAEGLAFAQREGAGTDDQTLLRLGAQQTIESIELVNCEISGYTKGIFYDNSKAATVNSFVFSSLLIHNIGDGQDTFDMRAGTYGSFTLENSSIYNGCRTILRGDSKCTFSGDITVKNNFFYKACGSTNGNNCGILSVRGTGIGGSYTLSDNLFVEMVGGGTKTGLAGTNSDTIIPTTISNNHFYNCTMTAWFTTIDQNAATAGGSMLAADPCTKSAALNFTLSNDVLIGKQVGDPRWWATAGPVIPEQIVTLSEGRVWDFSDAAYYAPGDVTETSVMGNLMFGVGSKTFTISSQSVVRYNAASALTADGIPSDGYLAFRVSTPGSVILKPVLSDNGTINDCINVVVNGKACGSAFAGTADDMKQKVVLKDLVAGEETMVYLVSTGAIDLSYLEWTTDTSFSPVSVQLETPTLKLSSKAVVNGTEEALTFSWNEIEHVHTYSLTFGDQTLSFASDVFTYTMPAATVKALAAGDYAVTLTAKADPDDARYKDSEVVADEFVVEFLGDGSPVTMAYPDLNSFSLVNVTDKGSYWEVTKNADANKVTDTAVPTTGGIYTPAVVSGKIVERVEITGIASMTKKGWLYGSYNAKDGYSNKCSAEFALNNTEVVTVTPTEERDRLYIAASTSGAMKITKVTVYYKDATPGGPVSYAWNFSDSGFDSYYTAIGTANNTDYTGTWNNLTILSGGGSIKVGATSDNVRYVQTGGAGSATKRCFSFTTSVSGTLKVTSSNTSDAVADNRMVAVEVEGEEAQSQVGGAASSSPVTLEFTITAASSKTVTIYSTGSGLRFYNIEFASK